jgi:cobalt/nickel transport system permease protein
VGSIIATRPDLVHGARGLVADRALEIRAEARP